MKQPKSKESGFALLMVFLLAACVAITLYYEMPRVAFEAERQKELLLIDRGNQFKRAIQLFNRDRQNNPTGNYPASIDQLENFNNHRYLRRRYVDPMTGKDDWRLIHTSGVPGVFPDSLTMGQQNTNAKDSGFTGSDYIKTLQSFDAPSGQQQGGGANAAMRRRPSDSAAPGENDGGGGSAGGSQGNNGDAGGASASGNPGAAGMIGLPGQRGLTPGGLPTTGGPTAGGSQTQQMCTAYIDNKCVAFVAPPSGGGSGAKQVGPGGVQQGQQAIGGAQSGGVAGVGGGLNGVPGGLPGGSPGMNTGQTPGLPSNPAAQGAAAAMIGNLLTSPRPGGMPANNPGQIVSGGIAGVASKYEADGIMVIADRTAINEWEFIFDLNKYRAPANPLGGGPGVNPNGQNGPGGGQNGPGSGMGGPGGMQGGRGGGLNGGPGGGQ
jgi:hypothetical protein